MLTIKALWLVNTKNLTAFGASPLFFFVSNEMHYAEFLDVLKIFDHAHAVLGSISVIQTLQPGTREAITAEAILGFRVHYLLTVLYPAQDANFRFEAVVAKAAWAWFLISCVC